MTTYFVMIFLVIVSFGAGVNLAFNIERKLMTKIFEKLEQHLDDCSEATSELIKVYKDNEYIRGSYGAVVGIKKYVLDIKKIYLDRRG